MKQSSEIFTTSFHTWRIINFANLESTHTHLLQHSQRYHPFTCIVAEKQTSGYGKYGRVWHAVPEKDLTFSLLVPLHNIAEKFWNAVTQVTALAITKTLEHLKIPACIKWPNDVLVRGKKICGILCTTHRRIYYSRTSHEKEPMLIIGIGLNVNSTEEDLHTIEPPATSIFKEYDKEYSKGKLLKLLLQTISECFHDLQEKNFTAIRNEIEKRWYAQKKHITLVIGKETHQGIITRLNEDASLQFHCETCGEMCVYSGEFSNID